MQLDAAIREIEKGMGPPKFRAAYGQWVPYAWIVRGLVESGHGVSEAVRTVIERARLHPPEVAVKSVRAAYYKIRTEPWPAETATGDAGQDDDFEV